jgi:hypothetical protein
VAVISITITNSTDQTVPGIPNTITLTTSEPATIFYTLDGCDPNTYSPIYLAPILVPYAKLKVILKVFATNGTDSSAIIEEVYCGDASAVITTVGDRLPHNAIAYPGNGSKGSLFPFGEGGVNVVVPHLNPSLAGTTVYNESEPATSVGYNADGYNAVFTNQPYNTFQFKQVYSTTNAEGEVAPWIGNLPGKVKIIGKEYPVEYQPEISNFADKVFNPRALVIYQDTTTEDPTNPVHINRPYFSLEDTEITRDGELLMNTGLDSPPTQGSFVNSFYNPRTNLITYYYRDNTVNRWIISSTPFQPTTKDVGNLSNMVFGRDSNKYFKWFSYTRRFLM